MDDKTIFRIVKNKDNPFVMIDRRLTENPSLTWRAKGVLSYLLSRPDDWVINMNDLINRSCDSEYITRESVDELMAAGHVVRHRILNERKQVVRYEYSVHEQPVPQEERTAPKSKKPTTPTAETEPLPKFPQLAKPQVENPNVDFPDVENCHINNTDLTNTDLTNPLGADAPNAPETLDRENPPASWGVGWQLGAGVKTVRLPDQGETSAARLANAVNLFPPARQQMARLFITETGIHPIHKDVSGWTMVFNEWAERGFTEPVIQAAIAKMRKDGLTISDPFSVTSNAKSAAGRVTTHPQTQTVSAAPTPLMQHLDNFKPRRPTA